MSLLSKDYREELEALFAKNGWNAERVHRSFASKGGYQVLSMERDGRFCIEVAFRQTRVGEYTAKVGAALSLASTMDRFSCYLFMEGDYRPLHEPVTIPVMYGFTAQLNQMHKAVSGLEYVYLVAGIEHLKFYPHGKREC